MQMTEETLKLGSSIIINKWIVNLPLTFSATRNLSAKDSSKSFPKDLKIFTAPALDETFVMSKVSNSSKSSFLRSRSQNANK